MQTHQTIPLELIEVIIDNLANDIPTLKACSITCRAFLTRSRVYLFSSINLTSTFYRPNTTSMFHEMLNSCPEIALFVRHLSVQDVQPRDLALVLPRFLKIESFSWKHSSGGRRANSLYDVHFNAAFQQMLHLTSLKSIHLDGFRQFPTYHFITFSRIENICLADVDLTTMSLEEKSACSTTTKFKSLQLTCVMGYNTLSLVKVLTLTSLQKLKIYSHVDIESEVEIILAAKSIVELEWYPNHFVGAFKIIQLAKERCSSELCSV